MIYKRLSTTAKLKEHSLYQMAKAGCIDAARIVIHDLLKYHTFNLKGYVCPVQRCAGNKLPYALAEYISQNSRCILYKHIQLLSCF